VRGALAGSAVVHGGLTLALFVLHPSHDVLVPGPDVVEVALVDPTPAPPQPVAKASPEPAPPVEDRGVRIEKPRPAPPRAKPTPPPPTPAPPVRTAEPPARVVLAYAPVAGGLQGEVAVDQSNFEFAYYLQQVRSLIARNWAPPAGVPTGLKVTVYFKVSRDGSLSSPRVETSSGNPYFDEAASRAVIVTNHLPPLPLGYVGADLGVHFGFEYTGP